MTIFIALVLALLTFVFIAYPLLKKEAPSPEDKKLLQSNSKRGGPNSIIAEIDDGIDEELERQIRGLRRGKGRFCLKCGARCQVDDLFCSRCGAGLNRGEHVD